MLNKQRHNSGANLFSDITHPVYREYLAIPSPYTITSLHQRINL